MKPKTKQKTHLTPPPIKSRAEAESIVADIANLTIHKIGITARMDAQIADIKATFDLHLAAYDHDLKIKTQTLCAWSQSHPEEFPKGRKSIEFGLGTIGFRTGTPKLALLSRKWNWDKVLGVLKTASIWVRTKEEVDKESILAEVAAGKYCNGTIAPFGIRVTQEETFYVDPKLTPVELRQTSEPKAA